MQKYKWLKPLDNAPAGDSSITFIAVPTLDELEAFIKESITTNNPIIRLHSYYYINSEVVEGLKTESERDQILNLLTQLFIAYHPWQFRSVIQSNKSFQIDWVETKIWLDKYKP